jgi:capsular polysaccharide biosynthesis protein
VELILFFRVITRRWYLVLIPVVIVAVVVLPDFLGRGPAVSGGFTTTFHYTAAQELDAIPDREGDFQDVWLASELTVRAFTSWMLTNSFAREVAQVAAERGLEIDPAALNIMVDNQRSVGQITLHWSDADEMGQIAQAVIHVLTTRNQAYFPQLGDAPARVRLLDEPRIVPAPPPLADRFGPIVRLGVALLVGVGLAFLADYLDPALRRREDLETLGLHVIATIPRK